MHSAPRRLRLSGKTICQVLYSNNPSQLAYARHVEEYAESMGMSVMTIDGKIDPMVQANGVDDCIASGADGIILQPVGSAAATGPIQAAQSAGIPIVVWGTEPDASVSVPFVELNEYEQSKEAGALAAQRARELWPDQAPSMVLLNIPTLPLCNDLRVGGFKDGVLEADPEAVVVADVDAVGDQLSATNQMEDIIQRGEYFNLVATCNGPMALGALSALESAGRGTATDQVPDTEYIYSVDGSPEEVAELLDPTTSLMAVLLLTPKEISRATVDTLTSVITGEIDMEEDYRDSVGSLNLPPDCDEVNAALREQYFQEEDLPCPA